MRNRRQILQDMLSTSLLASFAWGTRQVGAAAANGWPIAVFEKCFEGLNYAELADAINQIGADGVEATIRPRGHIEPAVAADEVPKMAEALAAHGKRIVIAATGINRPDQPGAEALLRTLKASGVTHYRMGYYAYDLRQPMLQQLRDFATKARELAALNREVGIQALYQTHAGAKYLGALGWDLAHLLEGIDPHSIGAALDLRHVRADTGTSWRTAVQVLKPHVRSIYVKDGTWEGERGNQLEDVPLDEGFVDVEMFNAVRAGLPPMPLCLHVEHIGYRVFEKHEIPRAIKAHQQDIQTLRMWLAS